METLIINKLCRKKKSITVAGWLESNIYHTIRIHQWFLIHYCLNYSAALTLTRIRQSSDEKFRFEGLRQLALLPTSSLSQLTEPSNWKGDPERLFSQMVHWDNNRIVDLTILFSAISKLRAKWRHKGAAADFGFFAASCAPAWLRPHVAPSLWPDGSQLIAKSHSWRRVTVQALSKWWLPSDRPNEAQRKSFSKKRALVRWQSVSSFKILLTGL